MSSGQSFAKATGPVLTSEKEEKYVTIPTTFHFAVRRGKLRMYTIQNSPEFAPPAGYKECAVIGFS